MSAPSTRCLCMFCGARKKRIVDGCPECSRRPQNATELAKSLLLSSPPVDVEGRTIGLEQDALDAVSADIRNGDVAWSAADIDAARQVVRGFREGSPWWSNLVVYGGFAASIVLLAWLCWLFVRRLGEFLS